MNFTISPTVFEKHPGLTVGVIVTTQIDNAKTHPEIAQLLRQEEAHIRSSMDPDTFRDHPHIASLQEVHRSFGSNPNKFPPSVQALVKRVLKGGTLPSINSLVDVYNIISLRYVICAGAEDTDACNGDIQLAFADGNEAFLPLGEQEHAPPEAGELVYKDHAGIICRKLNWREGDRTKITDSTKNAVVVVEGFPPFPKKQLEQALEELANLLQKYCRATTRIEVLHTDKTDCIVH
ncbi:hypothetical protein COU76_04610 [Candidatus Peregrinibacteria bacterium CG10_big_fil_rev_8_21_14_0_10_49_10]|nr:MAG: hypothetical protein COU76_04610 [Candidatus Peregrinibacteria bacterium CG10_big_fil_rev_8_21_14_0_10_49_10]